MLGVNENTVVKWENGKWNSEEKYRKLLLEFITRIAQYFKITRIFPGYFLIEILP
jgi:DNA-binding XRE family transcriptional regulator